MSGPRRRGWPRRPEAGTYGAPRCAGGRLTGAAYGRGATVTGVDLCSSLGRSPAAQGLDGMAGGGYLCSSATMRQAGGTAGDSHRGGTRGINGSWHRRGPRHLAGAARDGKAERPEKLEPNGPRSAKGIF
nr:unnamed protein product [Digitaria exilis]